MPKSDTWPGGIGLETMTAMDSAGSCDSVVSANSGFSDDSLEHLSAEEKACLMFLEETIESLDTEEDSGLSNDEPDQLLQHSDIATKLADLSASMSKSKINRSQELTLKELIKEKTDTKPIQSYLVPTPFVLASSSPYSLPGAKPSVPPDKSSQVHVTPSNKEASLKNNLKPVGPQAFSEVNGMLPLAAKRRDFAVRIPEGPLPRGPLSYEALVHLRRSASAKKTPLCPLIDHTLEMDKHPRVTAEGPNIHNLPRLDRSHSDAFMPKKSPPAVAPKPKRIPTSISDKAHTPASIPLDTVKHATDPQVVRLEALQKLGLLKDQQPNADQVAPVTLLKPNSSSDPTPNRYSRGTSNTNPSRSPSFCYSQVHSQPKSKPLQTSASFHHDSRHDQQPMSVSHRTHPSGLKAAGLGPSVNEDNHTNSSPDAAQPIPQKPSNTVPYTVMVVPGMGADRKEALRKLGLLKV